MFFLYFILNIVLTISAAIISLKCADKVLSAHFNLPIKSGKVLNYYFLCLCAIIFAVIFFYFAPQKIFPNGLFIFPPLIFCLISISIIDFKTRIIPDIFPISMLIFALLTVALNPFLSKTILGSEILLDRFLNLFLGGFCGGFFLFLTALLGQFIYKTQTLGGGDIKFMAATGALIGLEKIISAIFFGFCLGALIGGILILLKKTNSKEYIPFAPFLSGGIYLSLICPPIWNIFI